MVVWLRVPTLLRCHYCFTATPVSTIIILEAIDPEEGHFSLDLADGSRIDAAGTVAPGIMAPGTMAPGTFLPYKNDASGQ